MDPDPKALLALFHARPGMMYINEEETAMYVQWNPDVILMVPGDYRGKSPEELNLLFQAAIKKD